MQLKKVSGYLPVSHETVFKVKVKEDSEGNSMSCFVERFTDKYILSEEELKTLFEKFECSLTEYDIYMRSAADNSTKFIESLTK